MTLPPSGPISFSEIIGESSYGLGQLSEQDKFIRKKLADQYKVGDVNAPNFVDEYGQTPKIKFSEFYSFDGYDDNNFLISELEDGSQAHSSRIKDTGAFLITDDDGRALRTDDKVGDETIVKHKSESSSGGEVYLFAEFCRNFGFPYTRVFYEFTNNGNIENLYLQESSWPTDSEIILVNNGTVANPSNYGSYAQLL
jgi:hypothetical protein